MSENDETALPEAKPLSEERIDQYLGGRFGQRGDTRQRYAKAIMACESICYLHLSVKEIAGLYGHSEQSLRNQLLRHFPEIFEKRNKLREQLGLAKRPVGMRKATEERFAQAIQMLNETSLTVRQVAEKTGIGLQSLHQHLLFYHRELAEKRLKQRLEKLDKSLQPGEQTSHGGISQSRPESVEVYAKAVALYRTTDMTIKDIALSCGLQSHNLAAYLNHWHRDVMKDRQEKHRQEMARLEAERVKNRKPSRAEKAKAAYTPAIDLIDKGATFKEAAAQLNVSADNLVWWMRHHCPEIVRKAKDNKKKKT